MTSSGGLGNPGQEVSETHAAELERLSPDYWWLAIRRSHVQAALARVPAPFRYLDFGCGAGTVAAEVIARFAPSEALGIDGTHDLLRAAESRGVPVAYADFREALSLPFAPDAVTSLDVLEHLEDPVRALRNLADACSQDVTLVVTVPAMPALWSRWDEVSGHHRRYTRALLRAQLREGGWRPLRTRYLFGFGLPAAWVQRVLLRRVQEFEFPPVPRVLNAALTALGTVERALAAPLPFGTSLISVARRA